MCIVYVYIALSFASLTNLVVSASIQVLVILIDQPKLLFQNDSINFSLKCADCQSSREPIRTKLNSIKLF